MSVISRILSVTVFPFVLALLAGIACYVVAGASENWYIGALLFLTVIVPPLSVGHARADDKVAATFFAILPFVIVSFAVRGSSTISFTECLKCAAVVSSYAFALAGLAVGFRLLRCSAAVSAALSVSIGFAWMTWPVWMSRAWDGDASSATIARVGWFQPGMLIDGQLAANVSGGWTSQNIAYHLTELSQSVMYSPSKLIWPGVLMHAGIGGILFAFALAIQSHRRMRDHLSGMAVITIEPS